MSFPLFDSDYFIAVKCLPQTSAKLTSSKCHHFCFLFMQYLQSFSEDQQIKIKHRRWYIRKQKASDPCNTSKEDDLDLLGDDVEAFSGSQADLEGAAENLISSPPRPQPLRFESLSLKTPQTVPPIPGTALQNKIDNRLKKSLGSQFNIHLQHKMMLFHASMLEAMKSLRDEMHSMKKASKSDVVQTSDSLPKAGPSKQPDPIMTRTSIFTTQASNHSDAQPMDTDHYGPSLPPKSTQSVQIKGIQILYPTTRIIIPSQNNIKGCVQKPKKQKEA